MRQTLHLTDEQKKQFNRQGFLHAPQRFGAPESERMRSELDLFLTRPSAARVMEKDGKHVRAVHGCHLKSGFFERLTRHPWLLETARNILASDVYVYQFKINIKAAFGGDIWPWHQDFIYWKNEDGMPSPRVLNAVIYLDEVNEFNGPLFIVPGSHVLGSLPPQKRARSKEGWEANVSADLKYTVDLETVKQEVAKRGLISSKGPAGSLIFFHSNLLHGSVSNISPFNRRIIIITYNSVENIPKPSANPRPEFLVCPYKGSLRVLDQPFI